MGAGRRMCMLMWRAWWQGGGNEVLFLCRRPGGCVMGEGLS